MLDRISVSVLQLRLEAIVQEMGEATLRTDGLISRLDPAKDKESYGSDRTVTHA
jgi:hypothetical protein